ncbi:Aromatic-amino-acid aminotransferase [Glycine soja]|uniref:Aspartate aminotransferase n=1 Tax=Glycine soja TaxID=3848 RepID=A0A0B2PTL0_GLYSO|nr:Aromatic-amino-acid aminotransferase [Glycine soja]
MFSHVEPYAGDPILGLMDKHKQDPRADKVNLGVGVYFDNDGKLPVLNCVQKAEAQIANPPKPRPYLPMDGLPGYRAACQNLLFGKDAQVLKDKRVATTATIGGSGALKVGADFIHAWFPQAKCYVSDPTWANHIGIFEGSGFAVGKYPYYDAATNGIKFDELIAFLNTLQAHDVVLLHPCCHNPTGVDLTQAQWDKVLEVVKAKNLLAFMDIAYQGFGEDMDADVYAIRKAVDMGLLFFVSNSFSKNLSLYGERVGALFNEWVQEVYVMRDRIKDMRQKLRDSLEAKLPGRSFEYITKQNGMFSYTGLTPEQVARIIKDFGIYMVANGRISVAGLNASNIDYVANAMAEVLKD